MLRWLGVLTLASFAACAGGGGSGTLFDTGLGFNARVDVVAPATDGSGDLYVGGAFTDYDGTSAFRIARLNSDGSLDPGFDSGIGFNAPVFTIVPTTDGSGDIYVGGGFTDYRGVAKTRIARLNSDGSVDSGFDEGTGFDNSVVAIALANDGSGDVYVGGQFLNFRGSSRVAIARVNSDGSNDAGFDTGTGLVGVGGANPVVLALAAANDGSGDIYVGGEFSAYRGGTRNGLVRIDDDGARDTGFATGTGFDGDVYTIAFSTDGSGDIYLGGDFTTYRTSPTPGIVRVNSDSTFDGGFDVGTGAQNTEGIAVASDGSGDIYAVGRFLTYRGNVSDGLVRINSDGSFDPGFATGTGFGGAGARSIAARPGSTDVYLGGLFGFYDGEDIGDSVVRLGANGRRT